MTDTLITQIYLILTTEGAKAHSSGLSAMLQRLKPACVRFEISDSDSESISLAIDLSAVCHGHDIPLVIGGPDDVALAVAKASGADGVHLTNAPKAAGWIREALGDDCIVGMGGLESRHDAMLAAETGADYVALAGGWGDDSHVPDEIRWWAETIETPLVVEDAHNAERMKALSGLVEFITVDADQPDLLAAALAGLSEDAV